jgi:hypothetical protein
MDDKGLYIFGSRSDCFCFPFEERERELTRSSEEISMLYLARKEV